MFSDLFKGGNNNFILLFLFIILIFGFSGSFGLNTDSEGGGILGNILGNILGGIDETWIFLIFLIILFCNF
ncbi:MULTISPECIES: hypothetical protein [Tissierellales]|jgi:hypothetical protein|uniref:Uncharacterized protein n=1 Tax=Acidilutibacter cellobiosedens TaxID=2507161 RepID=A0A410QB82_9FIRM|nr:MULTISPECIES: hypothetical protein [Tissierellales]MBE6081934.1 hypothetical protein [Tissierellaceae bacterium]QAT61263.1 hypothetical protein EQM13_06495 [Acidilutibacter cellobiosedens]SCL96241.1 hypothetical protein PP176A_3047 [Sporanaerobacter sp. PP17-6a]